jgi:hypothetical protein
VLLISALVALPVAGARAQGFPPLGNRCEALFPTPGGPRRVVCVLPQPEPMRSRCLCAPPPPPGYPPLPPVRGRVIP